MVSYLLRQCYYKRRHMAILRLLIQGERSEIRERNRETDSRAIGAQSLP
jgi:hypothetical protein